MQNCIESSEHLNQVGSYSAHQIIPRIWSQKQYGTQWHGQDSNRHILFNNTSSGVKVQTGPCVYINGSANKSLQIDYQACRDY